MQRKWLVCSAGKIGYFAFVVSFFPMLMSRYPLSGVGAGGASATPKVLIFRKFGHRSFDTFVSY